MKLCCLTREYIKKMDTRDFALLKFCLCAAGLLIGLAVPCGKKKPAFVMAVLVFLAAYLPLMAKFIEVRADSLGGGAAVEAE